MMVPLAAAKCILTGRIGTQEYKKQDSGISWLETSPSSATFKLYDLRQITF